jgi:hypothetical protein
VLTSHWLQGKVPEHMQADSGMILGSLKRVTGRLFKPVSDFKGASENFEFDFSIN